MRLRFLFVFASAALLLPRWAPAMEVARVGTRLVVTGTHFRYTWDTRRGGELAVVEQPGLPAGGWWDKGTPRRAELPWQRVNSSFAWKSLDTIPALSFSTKRGSYYSGEWTIANANADRNAELKIVKQSPEELVFETTSNPRIFENIRAAVPWKVKQTVRVLDTGVVITRFQVELPKGEVYELDWASASVNLDDSLYKEPHPDRQEHFSFWYAFPGRQTPVAGSDQKPVLQALENLPLDIDIKPEQAVVTTQPVLVGGAAYDLTHVQGAAPNGFAECALEEARSLTSTKEDFGSHVMIRPQSGMSPVPTYAGSMRNSPCFGVSWNLFDGKTAGLNEPLTYANTLTFAVAARKRSSLAGAAADDRNNLLGARIYYARDKLPSADDVKAMAADGCDTLVLGPYWRQDAAAVVKAAHDAGLRVGATVDVRELKVLIADSTWFTSVFEKDRDGLLLTNASGLTDLLPQQEVTFDGEKVAIKHDGADRINAAGFALCMRQLRRTVGGRGFLIADPGANGPGLLSLAEVDLYTIPKLSDAYRWSSPQGQAQVRHRAGAGCAPVVDSVGPDVAGLSIIHGDTPVVLYPAKDKNHLALWKLYQQLPNGGFRIESDLLPVERRFTTSSPLVHGSLHDGGAEAVLLLAAADKPDSAKVTLAVPVKSVKALDGADVPVADNTFDAGAFAAWQVKGYRITLAKEAAQ